MISSSEESEHPEQSQIAPAFPRLSPGDLGVFVFAKQPTAAGVAKSNSGLCNMYDKREWYQHQRALLAHVLHVLCPLPMWAAQ